MSNMKLKSEKYFCTAVCKFDEADENRIKWIHCGQGDLAQSWNFLFGKEKIVAICQKVPEQKTFCS